MTKKIDEAMELEQELLKWVRNSSDLRSTLQVLSDLLRPILAERDALRMERDRMREALEKIEEETWAPMPDEWRYLRIREHAQAALGKLDEIRLAASPESPGSGEELDALDSIEGRCPGCSTVIMDNGRGAHHSASCGLAGYFFSPTYGEFKRRIAEAGE